MGLTPLDEIDTLSFGDGHAITPTHTIVFSIDSLSTGFGVGTVFETTINSGPIVGAPAAAGDIFLQDPGGAIGATGGDILYSDLLGGSPIVARLMAAGAATDVNLGIAELDLDALHCVGTTGAFVFVVKRLAFGTPQGVSRAIPSLS